MKYLKSLNASEIKLRMSPNSELIFEIHLKIYVGMFFTLIIVAFLAVIPVCSASRIHQVFLETVEFDWDIGNTSLWLSAAAYCETNTYLNRTYEGASAGFIPLYAIDNPTYDVQVSLIAGFFS